MLRKDEIYIVGHKNPDTDSICAAISYAYLKNRTGTGRPCVACRAGQINEETEFALRTFHHEPPAYLPDVGLQVSDMELDDTEGGPDSVTVRLAWDYMREFEKTTLPIMDDEGSL